MTTLRPPTFVDVLVPVALDHSYSYRVPSELELKPGDIVAVPLGAREVIGVVWADDVTIRAGVIDGLIDDGTLETLVLPPEPVARRPDPEHAVPEFTEAQRAAGDALRASVAKGGFLVTLVDGVTGSGKTEVYFEAVAEAIRQ